MNHPRQRRPPGLQTRARRPHPGDAPIWNLRSLGRFVTEPASLVGPALVVGRYRLHAARLVTH